MDTGELDFEALCGDLGELSCKNDKRKTLVSKGSAQEHVQTTLMATMLIEAMRADPVSPALKSGARNKPTSPVFKKPSKARAKDDDEED